jgi:dihydrodipicolinate synthase/N-acetylneuraminate lyase
MGNLAKLFGYCGVDGWVGVAVNVDPQGGYAVEVASAIRVNELIPFRALNH